MENKQTYYVSVSGKSIESDFSVNEQLEVLGTEEEIGQLQQLLDRIQKDDEITHLRAPIPYKSADHDKATDQFNEDIRKVYQAIYQLGTYKTREHIRQMNILGKLQDTDYNYPGYDR
ncbi:hypothetical protein KP806_10750 [Paenibacillus sp. N4]|uniref:hypothetical protein n=1 Tax=Paenibacillus vietnamensis TaxID=2590547 RepID=UPI001CD0CEE7|nr:hypothetical protein [Paenibacillus vietnamensis]MCA0755532.1 hypothetical protein [Paenibacillus vietnamensis]